MVQELRQLLISLKQVQLNLDEIALGKQPILHILNAQPIKPRLPAFPFPRASKVIIQVCS